MGAEKAEGLARTVGTTDASHAPAGVGFVGRRERRSRAHEYWKARPVPVREREHAVAPPRPVSPAPPLVQRPAAPVDHSSVGLPMRVAPSPVRPQASGQAPVLAVVPDQAPRATAVNAPYVPRVAAPGRGPVTPGAAASPAAAPAGPAPEPARLVAVDEPVGATGEVDEALELLVALAPHLGLLADDRLAEGRRTYARCHGLLARMGRSVADREVWRSLLRLCDADEDPSVRRAADEALAALEQYGTRPRG